VVIDLKLANCIVNVQRLQTTSISTRVFELTTLRDIEVAAFKVFQYVDAKENQEEDPTRFIFSLHILYVTVPKHLGINLYAG
jgi:hypothetical protein